MLKVSVAVGCLALAAGFALTALPSNLGAGETSGPIALNDDELDRVTAGRLGELRAFLIQQVDDPGDFVRFAVSGFAAGVGGPVSVIAFFADVLAGILIDPEIAEAPAFYLPPSAWSNGPAYPMPGSDMWY